MRFFYLVLLLMAAPFLGVAQHRYTETGVASYYAEDFHGRLTANGEVYDMHAMTAAHRSLPFNARVRVTNLGNGRSVEVRINDDGPHVGGRIIDLSKGAAKALDMIGRGTTRVRLERVDLDGPMPAEYLDTDFRKIALGGFGIQVRSFSVLANVKRQAAVLRNKGIAKVFIQIATVRDARVYRLVIGGFRERKEAELALRSLKEKSITGFVFKIR